MSGNKGFLSRADRPYLRGEKQYKSKQQRYDRRESIRTRTRAAFHDFALLARTEVLDETERNKIFDPPADEVTELMKAMIETVAFLYHALEGEAGSNAVDWDRTFRYPFGQVLEAGVRHGEVYRRQHTQSKPFSGRVDVTFEVDVTRNQPADWSRVVEDLVKNEGRGLTDRELRATLTHAVRDTVRDGREPTIDGEPLEDAIDDYHGSGLHGLAEDVKQRAKELNRESDAGE